VEIARAALDDRRVVELLEQHLREAHRNSPPGSVFAMDTNGLADVAVTLWGVWDRDALLGLGALKVLPGGEGEIKSMRTADMAQRRGVGRMMLDHLLGEARARGYSAVRLETGSNDAFAPARALYEAAGFTPGAAFGGYALTEFNRCYALALRP
jgi:putative acetyltransferase